MKHISASCKIHKFEFFRRCLWPSSGHLMWMVKVPLRHWISAQLQVFISRQQGQIFFYGIRLGAKQKRRDAPRHYDGITHCWRHHHHVCVPKKHHETYFREAVHLYAPVAQFSSERQQSSESFSAVILKFNCLCEGLWLLLVATIVD